MKLEGLDDQLMATAAHRYCLGRQSYIVSSCLDWLRATWPQFERKTRHVILRDTLEALIEDRAGGDIDVRGWTEAVQWMTEQMDAADRQAVADALEWKDAGALVAMMLTPNV